MFELVMRADEALVEPLTEQLIDELGALSASVEDADAAGPHEQALFGEPGMPAARGAWDHSRVVVLFEREVDAQTAAALLLAQHGAAGLRLEALRPVADQDWV
ncbi:MAG TPA: 50S ribosomal protein L11 methyltransferase, partial [Burkholderiaceae bacterium]